MGTKLAEHVENLFHSQRNEWKTVAQNYDELNTSLHKEITSEGFSLLLQCNPGRIRSSAAKVDVASILGRPCFLCPANLPEEQKSIDYSPDYNILINPYPIFEKHLTIACKKHTPQLIKGRIKDMLRLANDLQDYVILYNGPRSGASAPDHFHFQAGKKGLLPIEKDIRIFSGKKILKEEQHGAIYTMNRYIRNTLIYQSNNIEWLENSFESLLQSLSMLPVAQNGNNPDTPIPVTQDDEPMLNLIALYEDNQWSLIVFPRAAHRPSLYYEKGERQILFSPGAVDFGGLLIFPRKEDFDKINMELIESMFDELTLNF